MFDLNKRAEMMIMITLAFMIALIKVMIKEMIDGFSKPPTHELTRLKQACPAACLVEEIAEMAIAVFLYAILMGEIAIPMFLTVSTVGWGTYAILLWPIIPTVAIVVFIQAMFYHVKYGAYPSYLGGR